MSARAPYRGVSPPSLGQGLVIAAAFCAAWIFWSESRDRGWIPGLRQPANSVDPSRKADPIEPREQVSVAQLIVDLSNDFDPDARRQALLKLSSMGPAAAEAIDAIRERLKDESAGVRYVAVLALWRVSQDPEVVLPELPALLEDDSSGVREMAAETLEAIGRPAIGMAIKMVQNNSPAMRSRALLVLQRIVCLETFPEISMAVESLRHDPNLDVRTDALIACAHLGIIDTFGLRDLLRTDRTVPAVQPRTEKDRNSCEVALEAVSWLGPEAADLVPDLITLLEESPEIISSRTEAGRQVQVRAFAPRAYSILRTLGALKAIARPAVPHLLGRLEETQLDPRDRRVVIGTLVDIGAEPETLIPLCVPLLTAPLAESDQAERAGRLLARANPAEARRQVSLLIPKLADPNKPIDQVALYALWGMAREASEAVPPLISLLSDRGAEAAYFATETLGRLGPDAAPAVPSLIAILEQRRADGTLSSSSATFEALGNIGPAAKSAVPLLLALLNDPNAAAPPQRVDGQGEQTTYPYHEYAISALGKIATDSAEVASVIRRQLTSKSARRRSAAMHALVRPAKGSPQVLAEIIEILRNDVVPSVRANAALAIAAMSGDRRQALAPLADALRDSNRHVRWMAAIALGSMGPAAKSALPALRQAWLEAQRGIPSLPFLPDREPFALSRDNYELHQLPFAQALRQAIAEIDRTE